jgi:hypothetical protein
MTRVAWVHNTPPDIPGLLPGEFAGGGEMADAGMIARAPFDVDVDRFAASDWEAALDYDRIVIAATDQLSDQAMKALAERKPVVWVHHLQTKSAARRALFEAADPFICMSELHAGFEGQWTDLTPMWNHGWIDPCDVFASDKTGDALWAARNHPQKGLIGARLWAQRPPIDRAGRNESPRHLRVPA